MHNTSSSTPFGRGSTVILASVAAAVALAACGGGGGDSTTPPEPVLTKDICFDNRIYGADAAYVLNYLEDGTRTVSTSGTVRATNASYEGVTNLIEFREVTQNTVSTVVTRYLKPLAPGIVAQHATVAAQGAAALTTTHYSPPFEDRRAEMLPGETRTFTGTGTRVVSGIGVSSDPLPYERKDTIKFVGIERITTAAGTFTACRFEDASNLSTEWWHRSMVVRRDLNGGSSRVLQSGSLNGVAIKDL